MDTEQQDGQVSKHPTVSNPKRGIVTPRAFRILAHLAAATHAMGSRFRE
jgi:hypothetical protein